MFIFCAFKTCTNQPQLTKESNQEEMYLKKLSYSSDISEFGIK